MEKEYLPIVIVESGDAKKFEAKCAELFRDGYKLSSSSCGFVQSEKYDFCSSFQAIFVHKTEL